MTKMLERNQYVCKYNQCTGCMACVELCPKAAIRIDDSMISYNANIDIEKCINCNICHSVCQINNVDKVVFKKPLYWLEGWTSDKEIRKRSSSGGLASQLARKFIQIGGIVFSCCFLNGEFIFRSATSENDIGSFTGSKYVKSNPYGIYKSIRKYISEGRKVLFVGLPCQTAAVLNVVGNSDNLFTIDLICHGTPSPKILDLFLKDHQFSLRNCKNIKFREKDSFKVDSDGRTFSPEGLRDYYTMSFLDSVIYTENCYDCKFARIERVSDITLGDSWGSELSESEKRKGISLVLCQTEKGYDLLQKSDLELFDVDLNKAVEANHQLSHPSSRHRKRDLVLGDFIAGKSFTKVMHRRFPKRFLKNIIKMILIKMKIMRGGGRAI